VFILFAAPPEDQLEWNDSGLEGAWRFLNRVYQMVEKRYVLGTTVMPASLHVIPAKAGIQDDADSALERERNSAIKKVTQSFEEGYKFNTAISHLMVFANAIDKYKVDSGNLPKQNLLNGAIETLVLLLSPFAPHMSEELWQMMGKEEPTISHVAWPSFDEGALKTATITIAVQVNGKVRGRIQVAPDLSQEELRKICLADPGVAKYAQESAIKKFIVVPNKLVSIVV
jgi:leucyl-tRNA synthetase